MNTNATPFLTCVVALRSALAQPPAVRRRSYLPGELPRSREYLCVGVRPANVPARHEVRQPGLEVVG